jgi:hypothetical protein
MALREVAAAGATTRRRPKLGSGPDVRLQDVPFRALAPLWACGAYVVWYVIARYPGMGLAAADARAYWLTAHHRHLYSGRPGTHDAYVYSPAFAQLIHPLAALPWVLFVAVWALIEIAAFAWLLAPLGWRWAMPLVMVCSIEIGIGNIYGVLGVALVLGMRYAGAWAFPLLTKITPGVGLLWFAVRRDWRALGGAVAVTAIVAATSYLLAPGAWQGWIRFLYDNAGSDGTLPYRVLLGAGLAVLAARRNAAWLLGPAVLVASPVLGGWLPVVFLAVIPRLRLMHQAGHGARS